MQKHDTIIIGAGMAGIGCAQKLKEAGKDFLIITEDIGGRLKTSVDGQVNYGACFVLDDYYHVLSYVDKKEKLRLFSMEFHDKVDRPYRLRGALKHPLQMLRVYRLLRNFKVHYDDFKDNCETIGQLQGLSKDSYLQKIYSQTAADFAIEQKIADVANKYLQGGVFMCTFLPLTKVSAFDMLRLCLSMIVPVHEFVFKKEKVDAELGDNIVIDSVIEVGRDNGHQVQTKSGKTYQAKNLVIATHPQVSKKLLKIKKIKDPSVAHVFHVAGEIRPAWSRGQFEIFWNSLQDILLRKQVDGTSIFYSKSAEPNLEKYFVNPKVIYTSHWDPAYDIIGDILWKCEQGKNLYLIGDHNMIGLEDAFITGLYAANRILTRS